MKVNFEVIHNERGWVVIRINGDYKQHAHLKSKHGVDILLDCIRKNKLPHSQYLQVSCQRLLTEKELSSLKPPKQMYVNVNKGKKKR